MANDLEVRCDECGEPLTDARDTYSVTINVPTRGPSGWGPPMVRLPIRGSFHGRCTGAAQDKAWAAYRKEHETDGE